MAKEYIEHLPSGKIRLTLELTNDEKAFLESVKESAGDTENIIANALRFYEWLLQQDMDVCSIKKTLTGEIVEICKCPLTIDQMH